jgi:hypothetical protein
MCVVRRVSYFPTPAAIRGVEADVESAADISVKIAERREFRGETIIPV